MKVAYKYVIKYLLALTHQIEYFDKIFFVGLKNDFAVKSYTIMCIPQYVQVSSLKKKEIRKMNIHVLQNFFFL